MEIYSYYSLSHNYSPRVYCIGYCGHKNKTKIIRNYVLDAINKITYYNTRRTGRRKSLCAGEPLSSTGCVCVCIYVRRKSKFSGMFWDLQKKHQNIPLLRWIFSKIYCRRDVYKQVCVICNRKQYTSSMIKNRILECLVHDDERKHNKNHPPPGRRITYNKTQWKIDTFLSPFARADLWAPS